MRSVLEIADPMRAICPMIDTTGVGNTFLVVAIYGSLANWINRDIVEPFVRFAAQA